MNPALTTAGQPRGGNDGWLPSLAAAVLLHAVILVLVALFGLPKLKPGGTAVPINIVANAPTTDSRAAEQAEKQQTAQTETPVPEAPPEATPPPAASVPAPPVPAPPKPHPVPAPAKPTPAKTVIPPPKPTPVPAKPIPVKPAPPQPAPSFDLNKLQASIDTAVSHAAHAKPSSAPRGPPRAETAPQPRPSAGQGVSTSDIEGLGQLLNRLWNPNCTAPVDVNLSIDVNADGRIRVDSGGRENSSDMVEAASVRAAIRAVHKVEPYDPKFRGQHIPIRFNAQKACANG